MPTMHLRPSLLLSAVLAGCASAPAPSAESDAADAAGVRIWSGSRAAMHLGRTCYGKGRHPTVSTHTGGWVQFLPNKTAGLPRTQDTPLSFNEYHVPGGQVLTMEMAWGSKEVGAPRCGPVGASFVPGPGKNYDVSLQLERNYCWVRVREIVPAADGTVGTTPVQTTPALLCGDDEDHRRRRYDTAP